jgi:hypothetical protein
MTSLRISSTPAFLKGSSRFGSILTLMILTGVLSFCSASASAVEILSTTSMPSVTWPKAENWPSSWDWADAQMKN